MPVTVVTPDVAGLTEVVAALREWQDDDAPIQLHPGDIGWFWRFGAQVTAEAVRVWRRAGRIVAIGLLDGPTVLRLTLAPDLGRDESLAERIADDVTRAERGVLPAGSVAVESPPGAVLQDVLVRRGWSLDEAWTPLRRQLSASVGDRPAEEWGLRIAVVDPDLAHERVAVHVSAFDNSTFTYDSWRSMASCAPYADARCLLGYDESGTAVAAATVWSAGPGRPGLLEPVGVHREHRGRSFGTAITVASVAALRELGSSSAWVCTPSRNVTAVGTYASAGFEPLSERLDVRRPA
ncbi:MAG: GNAT family N-acetyltransferase [Frankiales bacterium]|nr:GNAT family N-acetyltransferase [Frankiales bacterium]